MENQEHSSLQKSNEHQHSFRNESNIPNQENETIDTCTMDPCPMKETDKNDHDHVEKRPHCGKTEDRESA